MDPLRIGVEIDASAMSGLADAAKTTVTSLSELQDIFVKGNITAEEFGQAAGKLSQQIAKATPAALEFGNAAQAMRDQVDALKEKLSQTNAMIAESAALAGGPGTSMLRQQSAEMIQVAAATSALTAVTKAQKSALEETIASVEKKAVAERAAAEATMQAAAAAADAMAVAAAENEGMAASQATVSEASAVQAEALSFVGASLRQAVSGFVLLSQAQRDYTAAQERAVASILEEGEAIEFNGAALRGKINVTTALSQAEREYAGVQMQGVAANLESYAAQKQNAAGLAQVAQGYMRSGLGARDSANAMKGLGYTTEQTNAAFKEMGITLPRVSAEIGQVGQRSQTASAQIGGMQRAMALATGRIAASELGVGQLGFAMSRLGAISQTVAPILAAAFPAFAAIAFVQIIIDAEKALEGWATAEQKATDEAAKFAQEMSKGSDAAMRAREGYLGAISPLAGLTQQMADAGKKSLDLSSETAALNKSIEDMPGLWTAVSTRIGEAWIYMTEIFRGGASDAGRESQKFFSNLADGVQTTGDVGTAIAQVGAHIRQLQADMATYQQFANTHVGFGQDAAIENFQKLISKAQAAQGMLLNIQSQGDSDMAKATFEGQEKIIDARKSAQLAAIGQEQSYNHILTTIHAQSLEEQLKADEAYETRRRNSELASVDAHIKALDDAKQRDPSLDTTAATQALQERRNEIISESLRRGQEMWFTSDKNIQDRDESLANAQIENAGKVAEAKIRSAAEANRMAGEHADTPAAIEENAQKQIAITRQLYDVKLKMLRDEAENEKKLLNGQAAPKAEIGTDEFAEQLKSLDKVAPEVVNRLVQLNAEIRTTKMEGANAELQDENQKNNKLRTLATEELNISKSLLEAKLGTEREEYQQGAAALEAHLREGAGHYRTYYEDVATLSQANLRKEMADIESLVAMYRRAAQEHIISAQQEERAVAELMNREVEARRQASMRELQAAKTAIEKEDQDVKRVANNIVQSFTQMANKILTTHMSIGNAAKQLGAQLELYIIDQGIKKVATKYALSFVEMLADHVGFIARFIGIDTAGNAAKAALARQAAMAQVGANAAESGAAGFASVMEALPFPMNIAVAPGVATAASGETLAYSSLMTFEKGGVVPANLHAGEMVLPQHISNFVQGAAAAHATPGAEPGGSRGGGSTPPVVHNHHHYNVRVDGAQSHGDIKQMVYEQMLPAIKQARRKGALGA